MAHPDEGAQLVGGGTGAAPPKYMKEASSELEWAPSTDTGARGRRGEGARGRRARGFPKGVTRGTTERSG